MPISKYVSRGKNSYYVSVLSDYAAHIDMDGTIVTAEITDLENDRFYDQDENVCDAEVSEFLKNIYTQPIEFASGNVPAIDFIEACIYEASNVYPMNQVVGFPKLTKQVAEGLDKMNEAATFYMNENNTVCFLCFGTRKEALDCVKKSSQKIISVSAANLYHAMLFRGAKFANIIANTLVIWNYDRKQVGIIMGIDTNELDSYRESENKNDETDE